MARRVAVEEAEAREEVRVARDGGAVRGAARAGDARVGDLERLDTVGAGVGEVARRAVEVDRAVDDVVDEVEDARVAGLARRDACPIRKRRGAAAERRAGEREARERGGGGGLVELLRRPVPIEQRGVRPRDFKVVAGARAGGT